MILRPANASQQSRCVYMRMILIKCMQFDVNSVQGTIDLKITSLVGKISIIALVTNQLFYQTTYSMEVPMQDKKVYANGQKMHELQGNQLTYFYKSGKVKAKGTFENRLIEGEWLFYRESGQLWQVGHFVQGKKNGPWVRYGKLGELEYAETYMDDQLVKKH
jgi:antitoxin component YwqK of YwqJK toxin-antitoxin module